jgi:hypothetical protein
VEILEDLCACLANLRSSFCCTFGINGDKKSASRQRASQPDGWFVALSFSECLSLSSKSSPILVACVEYQFWIGKDMVLSFQPNNLCMPVSTLILLLWSTASSGSNGQNRPCFF